MNLYIPVKSIFFELVENEKNQVFFNFFDVFGSIVLNFVDTIVFYNNEVGKAFVLEREVK